ncbi:MAG TPA: flagellar hook-basal body complex protein [Gaiellaceae bacterium]|nr:flagellar hook-basal body complex protein [Gaiellaceae bacterium]
MRSLFAAISGLRAHQEMLDVTANDIANVNTIGFKGSTVSFKDALSQMQSGASGPSTTLGGTNAQQIGLGVQMGAISNNMGSGAIQSTGNTLDLAIQGTGWFRVAGIQTAGTPPTFGTVEYTRAGNFTTDANGNLVTQEGDYVLGHAVATQGPPPTFGTTDSQITIPANATSVSIGQDGVVSYVDPTTGATTAIAQITLARFPNETGLQSLAGTKYEQSPNSGAPTVGVPGDSNGLGTLASGSLEMSNVDLATEFTNMIEAQRGFQANGRIITTADQMLQDLVQLGQG